MVEDSVFGTYACVADRKHRSIMGGVMVDMDCIIKCIDTLISGIRIAYQTSQTTPGVPSANATLCNLISENPRKPKILHVGTSKE